MASDFPITLWIPPVICYTAIENDPVEIVDFPIQNDHWLVVSPLWQIVVNWDDYSQYMEK